MSWQHHMYDTNMSWNATKQLLHHVSFLFFFFMQHRSHTRPERDLVADTGTAFANMGLYKKPAGSLNHSFPNLFIPDLASLRRVSRIGIVIIVDRGGISKLPLGGFLLLFSMQYTAFLEDFGVDHVRQLEASIPYIFHLANCRRAVNRVSTTQK